MKLTQNKILITGGSSGLGLEMSKRLMERNNSVIICSRSEEKLRDAQKAVQGVITYPCDLSDEAQCIKLADWIRKEHPDTNILINNAAVVSRTRFMEDDDILWKSWKEISTNFLAPVRLSKLLLPVLLAQKAPAIINITTGLVYAPKADYSFYNSTKAALHSFSQVLRYQLQNTPVKVVEVLFPAVDTPWHNGHPPKIAISAEKAVNEMLEGLLKDKAEIKVGGVKLLYFLSRLAPRFAFKKINSLAT